MHQEVLASVREFVCDNFLLREELASLPDEASFLGAGVIDSTGVLELVAFLESAFGIEVADEDMVPQNLDSIAAVAAYVKRKMGSRAAQLAA